MRIFKLIAIMLLLTASQLSFAEDRAVLSQWPEGVSNSPSGNLPSEFFKADAPTVVAMMLEAYGGPVSISANENVFARGRGHDPLFGNYYTYSHYLASKNRMRIDKIVDGRKEVSVYNGWRSFKGVRGLTYTELTGYDLMSLEFEHRSLTIPLLLSRGSYKASFMGTSSLDNKLVYSLLIEPERAPPLGVDVDVKTGLILRVNSRLEYRGETMLVERRFGSYVEMNNTKMPKKILKIEDGSLIEVVEIFAYDIAPSISESLFKK
jgi:hypothetical protein